MNSKKDDKFFLNFLGRPFSCDVGQEAVNDTLMIPDYYDAILIARLFK